MESALYYGIRFMDKTDEDLISGGGDIRTATESMNRLLLQKEEGIEKAYNDDVSRKEKIYLLEIDEHLFNRKVSEKE